MSTYRLETLFAPRSVAVVGASPRHTSTGRAVLANLRQAGFPGPIYLVNPRYDEIEGIRAFKSYDALPQPPDVVAIAVPPAAVPDAVAAAARKGTAVGVIITAGLGRGPGSLAERCEKIARAAGMRLVGPNCLGVQVPRAKLNASFAAAAPPPGDLALISQSGAIAAGLVQWASGRGVGFSAIVSIGDSIDVDFADLLDHFVYDRSTRAILLYIESIKDARKFMSAARAAARIKPVLVIKSGRHAQGAKAAMTHTGALAGSDAVYDAAFRRAGLLRVIDLDELFAAAETLARLSTLSGKRLAILTNGGGVGVMAVDRLIDLGGELAGISPGTMQKLDAALPPIWSRANPADIAGDADAERYAVALEGLLDDDANDAVLVMNVPTALASAADAAKSVIAVTARHRSKCMPSKPVFTMWMGESGPASQAFEAAGIPNYPTESAAIHGFMHLVRYREARDLLMATPPNLPEDFAPDVAAVRPVIDAVLRDDRAWLDPIELTRVLSAYGIPVAPAALARNADEAVAAAKPHLAKGIPVVLKIQSPDIVHKSDVGGVRLDLASEEAVRAAAADILSRAHAARAGRAHRRRDSLSYDCAPEGAGIDYWRRRRSDLRPGHRLRAGRHRRRGHQRQGAGAAPAQSRPGTPPDCAHARVPGPQSLPQCAGGRRARYRVVAGQAVPAGGGFSGNPRDRPQPGSCRRDRRHRRRRAGGDRASRKTSRRRYRQPAFRHPALPERMGAAYHAARRHGGFRPSGPPRRRAALWTVLRRGDA